MATYDGTTITWSDTPLIAQIKLPSGNSYYIKDREAREEIEELWDTVSGGVTFIVAWDGTSAPVVANIPAGVVVKYNSTTYTGTLAATAAQPGAFYLVKSSSSPSGEVLDVYDEYVPVKKDAAATPTWEKIGDTQLDLSDYVIDVTTSKDVVLGEATTFTNSSSAVSFTGGTTDKVLGEATTFALTSGSVSFGTPTKESFVTSVSADTTNKLVVASITPVSGTTTAHAISGKTDGKLVTTSLTGVSGSTTASKVTAATSQTTVKGFTASTTNTDILKGASVSNEILTLGAVAAQTQTTTQFTAANVTVPIASASATTVATGSISSTASGATVITAFTATSRTVAVAGTATNVATGGVATTGTGSAIVTDVTIGSSADAITALPTASVGTGITVGTNDKVTAVTGIGTGTAAAQTITVGTNDKVSAVIAVTPVHPA